MSLKVCNICGEQVEVFYSKIEHPLYIRPVPGDLIAEVPSLPIDIALCNRCNHIILLNPPDNQLLEKVYTTFYSSFHSTSKTGIGKNYVENFYNFLIKKLQNFLVNPGKVLEIGCSDGYFLYLLDRQGWEVFGCDPSPLAEELQKVHGKRKIKKDFYSKELFPSNFFDLIVFRHLLEHISNPLSFLSDVSHNLKPGSFIAIEVPDVTHTLQVGVAGDFCHEHISYFTPQSLQVTLGRSGFHALSIQQEGPVLYALARKPYIPVTRQVALYAENLQRLRCELVNYTKQWEFEKCNVFIYGAGGHTTDLLNFMLKHQVAGLIDSDSGKWGKYLPGFDKEVFPPEKLSELLPGKDVVIVSSQIFQDEIVELLSEHIKRGIKVLTLYPHCRYI